MNSEMEAKRPRLARGVRLHEDRGRGGFVLLAPERVFTTNAIAVEIIRLLDGERTVYALIDELSARFSAERARVALDVETLLRDLAAKRMVEL